MTEIEIKITIKQTSNNTLRVLTEIPSNGNAMLICGQLQDISRAILKKVNDKMTMNCFATESEAIFYTHNVTMGDLA